MIRLRFKGLGPGHAAVLGPANQFRVSGNFVRNAESGEILARYHNYFWDVSGERFTSYECTEPVTLHFEDFEGGCSDMYGPFPSLFVADGSMYANDKLIAKFVDQTLLWHDHHGDTFWPHMLLG